jgi:hypothetical protein
MIDEPCKREHLRGIRPTLTHWEVDDNGDAVECLEDYEDDILEVEQYVCLNCHEAWMPGLIFGPRHISTCWEQALDHLPSVTTGDGRIVRVEVDGV